MYKSWEIGLTVYRPYLRNHWQVSVFSLMQVFSSLDLRIAMPHETNLFSTVNRDFRILMKITEKNPNVLQACSRISMSNVKHYNWFDLFLCWAVLFILITSVRHINNFLTFQGPISTYNLARVISIHFHKEFFEIIWWKKGRQENRKSLCTV